MANYVVVRKGGPGSGFEGHAGRPGRVGGSAPSRKGEYMVMDSFAELLEDALAKSPIHSLRSIATAAFVKDGKIYHLPNAEMGGHEELAEQLSKDFPEITENKDDPWFEGRALSAGFIRMEYSSHHKKLYLQADKFTSERLADVQKIFSPSDPIESVVIEGWREDYKVENWTGTRIYRHTEIPFPWLLGASKVKYTPVFSGSSEFEIVLKEVTVVKKGGPGSGFVGHSGRPGKVGGSRPKVGAYGELYIGVPASRFKPGTKPQEMHGQDAYQPSGSAIRGEEVIDPDDARIPDIVYHMTTSLSAVKASGKLLARGVGGLGGDRNDQIVSMTTDKDIADQLAKDTQMYVRMSQKYLDSEPRLEWDNDGTIHVFDPQGNEVDPFVRINEINRDLDKYSQREGWVFSEDVRGGQGKDYKLGDILRQYFIYREGRTFKRNPIFFTDVQTMAKLDPKNIGVISIPKESLKTGALLMNFDLGRVKYGLKEIRLYGDVPVDRAQFERKELIVKKGGKGSGFKGHVGRPGKVGGSAAEGGVATEDDAKHQAYLAKRRERRAAKVGKKVEWHQKEFPFLQKFLGDNLHVEGDGEVQRRHLTDLNRLPDHLLVALKDGGVQIYVSDKPITEVDGGVAMKGVRPRGWGEGDTWDQVAGCYIESGETHSLLFGKGRHGCDSLVYHETGHALDHLYDKQGMGFGASQRKEFRDARSKAIKNKIIVPEYYKQPGTAGQRETFAGIVDMIFSFNPERARMHFGKECTDYVVKVLNEM